MKGDFTRSTFKRWKHYSSVRMQQGRVQLDADWNEQLDIQGHHDKTTRYDVIGSTGAPIHHPGFGITVATDAESGDLDLSISPGRLYVDGILCENEGELATAELMTASNPYQVLVSPTILEGRPFAVGQWLELLAGDESLGIVRITEQGSYVDAAQCLLSFHANANGAPPIDVLSVTHVRRCVTFLTQPDTPPEPAYTVTSAVTGQPALVLPTGTFVVYLDVWRRHITALEDPGIREVALGGPDTTTRTRTLWQVKLLPVYYGSPPDSSFPEMDPIDCASEIPAWDALIAPSTGKLSARAQEPLVNKDPCIVPAKAGYRRLENQLYRVEIHRDAANGGPTFKWSRDNGIVLSRVKSVSSRDILLLDPPKDDTLGYAIGDTVEIITEAWELQGKPGVLATLEYADSQKLTVVSWPVGFDPTSLASSIGVRVRRWDSKGEIAVSVPPANDGWIALEDGVEVRFEIGSFRSGNFWLIPARTVTGAVEWPRDNFDKPVPVLPNGIRHHYCRLGLIEQSGIAAPTIEDCRKLFPPLTEIECDDLSFHNKHLHGWGIVCGLQVECCPEKVSGCTGEHVRIRPGYAIDCEGKDIRSSLTLQLNVMELIEQLDAQDPNDPVLDEKGSGEVCLTLARDAQGRPKIAMERYEPWDWQDSDTWMDKLVETLDGTLLMDLYNDTFKPIVEYLTEQFDPEAETVEYVTEAQKRLSVLTSLFVQVSDEERGKYVYLSPREHQILLDLYESMRELLKSDTYCGMLRGLKPPPDPYPSSLAALETQGADTIFSKNFHVRLRLRPGTAEGYTVGRGVNPSGPTSIVHRFDLEKEALIAEIDPVAGVVLEPRDAGTEGYTVQDVGFSTDGSQIYVVATRSEEETWFRRGIFDKDGTVMWDEPATWYGVKLVTLAGGVVQGIERLYAIGLGNQSQDQQNQGPGLYEITFMQDPIYNVAAAAPPSLTRLAYFYAYGHLELSLSASPSRAMAYATASNYQQGTEPSQYDQVVQINLASRTAPVTVVTLPQPGHDDLTLLQRRIDMANGQRIFEMIFVVVGESGQKRVLVLNSEQLQSTEFVQIAVPGDDAIRLKVIGAQSTPTLLATVEDHHCIYRLTEGDETFDDAIIPVQVNPRSLAYDSKRQQIYVLNYASNTLTAVPEAVFSRGYVYPQTDLEAYRQAWIDAMTDMAARFLQTLKDSICDHLLINCPTCDEKDRLFLGCVMIRDRQVYKICNLSKRRYVKSFPTVGYWMSLVPVLPIAKVLLEELCCLVLPDLDISALFNDSEDGDTDGEDTDDSDTGTIDGTEGTNPTTGTPVVVTPGAVPSNVAVTGVRPQEKRTRKQLMGLIEGLVVKRGQQSTNLVKALTSRGRASAGRAVSALLTRNPKPKQESSSEVATLRHELKQTRQQLAERDQLLKALRTDLTAMEKRQLESMQAATEKTAGIQTELQELREFRAQVTEFMKRKTK